MFEAKHQFWLGYAAVHAQQSTNGEIIFWLFIWVLVCLGLLLVAISITSVGRCEPDLRIWFAGLFLLGLLLLIAARAVAGFVIALSFPHI